MPKSKTKTRSKLPKKDIKEAARKLLIRKGISGVSMRDIAQLIDASAMMPYRHFPSKDHLLMELRIDAFQALADKMKTAIDKTSAPEEALLASSIAYLEFALEFPNEYKLMFDQWKFENIKALVKDFGEQLEREHSAWRVNVDVISTFIEAEQIKLDKQIASHLAWSQLHGLVQLHLSRKLVFGLTIEELKIPCVRTIVASLKSLGRADT